jgi:flavin-dependent dehydrogenase
MDRRRMNSCDVLIVGGGPAGSSCAARLVQAGLDVLLMDRAGFPRDKVCAGWITPAVVSALNLDLADYGLTRTIQPFTGFRTGALGRRSRLTDFAATISYGIRRCEFDHYLLERSGVRRADPEIVRVLQRDAGGWTVNGTIRARLIVGAGGHFCPVARELNRGAIDAPPVAAQEIEFELDPDHSAACDIDGTAPELLFWPDLMGYAWCVRKGAFLNIGAGRLSPSPLPAAMREFGAVLESRGLLPPQPPKWKGHAYLLNRTSSRRLVADQALLIGDAAGLALAPSGEGILAAVESATLAADVIVDARHDYSARRLSAYARRIDRRFGPRATAPTRAFPQWLTTLASGPLLHLPWLTRRVLLEDGFLHTRRPALRHAF